MRVFKIDQLADYILKDGFTFGFEIYSGMTLPEKGETILAILDNRELYLKILTEPAVSLLRNSLICTFRVALDTDNWMY
jgi:hypothetical protein